MASAQGQKVKNLATADELHNFITIPSGNPGLCPLRARKNLQIPFDGNPSVLKAKHMQQIGNRVAWLGLALFAVHNDCKRGARSLRGVAHRAGTLGRAFNWQRSCPFADSLSASTTSAVSAPVICGMSNSTRARPSASLKPDTFTDSAVPSTRA